MPLAYTIIGVLSIFVPYAAVVEGQLAREPSAPTGGLQQLPGPGQVAPPDSTKLVTVDAAYGFELDKHHLILFVGYQAQALVDHKFTRLWERDVFNVPDSMKVQAAYTRPGNPFYRRYFGDEYGINVRYRAVKRFKYGRQRAFLRNGGPDAAGKRAEVVYFFKGCKMVVRGKLSKWGRIRETSTVGLPCDVHAAWAEQNKMVVLKGDQYWNWEQDNSVNGPHDFHANYTLSGWTLRPATTSLT